MDNYENHLWGLFSYFRKDRERDDDDDDDNHLNLRSDNIMTRPWFC